MSKFYSMTNMNNMGKTQEHDVAELIKQAQASIPEIRKEIDEFLAGRPLLRAELEEALSHLQHAQSIFEARVDSQVPQAFSELEQAKSIAIQKILKARINAKLQTDGLRAGRHILRDERRWKTGEFWVVGLWVVTVLPSFDPPAVLTVVHERERIRGAFGVAASPDRVSTSVVSIDYSPGWSDPVAQVLHELDLFDFDGGLSLDGISYELQIATLASKTQISFSNPVTRHLIALQQALFWVAEEMVNRVGTQPEHKYLTIWQKYLDSI